MRSMNCPECLGARSYFVEIRLTPRQPAEPVCVTCASELGWLAEGQVIHGAEHYRSSNSVAA